MQIKNRIDPTSRVSADSAITNKEDILSCISRLLIFRFILIVCFAAKCYYSICAYFGEMSESPKEHDWKSCVR